MKLQIQLTYSTSQKAYGLRNIGGKTRRFMLRKSHEPMNQYKQHFFDHILNQDHANFYVYNRPNNKPTDT